MFPVASVACFVFVLPFVGVALVLGVDVDVVLFPVASGFVFVLAAYVYGG